MNDEEQESAATASGLICPTHGVQSGTVCPICRPASGEGMPELSYGELMMMCEGHGTSKIYERFLALRSYALSLREKREGLKLVPIEPTETMISHAMTACVAANFSVQNFPFNAKAQERVLLAAAYRAMLSAAPSAGGEER